LQAKQRSRVLWRSLSASRPLPFCLLALVLTGKEAPANNKTKDELRLHAAGVKAETLGFATIFLAIPA
jgi:hypothetical protein